MVTAGIYPLGAPYLTTILAPVGQSRISSTVPGSLQHVAVCSILTASESSGQIQLYTIGFGGAIHGSDQAGKMTSLQGSWAW